MKLVFTHERLKCELQFVITKSAIHTHVLILQSNRDKKEAACTK